RAAALTGCGSAILFATSEEQLRRELRLARDRVADARDRSEAGRAERRVRVREAWRVGDVVHLDAQLQLRRAAQADVLEERQIEAALRRAVQGIARRAADRVDRLRRKRRGVEPLIDRRVVERRAADQIRAI